MPTNISRILNSLCGLYVRKQAILHCDATEKLNLRIWFTENYEKMSLLDLLLIDNRVVSLETFFTK